jgi:predicted lactoylglutathione lyase
MPGLDPGIHAVTSQRAEAPLEWIAGSSPAMTKGEGSAMSAHITLITLGVADVAKATAFYETLGFVRSKKASQESVSFFRAGGVVLALWSREAQRDDAKANELWTGNGGIVVAQNVASERDVDAVMARAEAAGARILKPSAKTFWGGYDGYFADPDGHVWEVAFNPHWELDEQGRIDLPK